MWRSQLHLASDDKKELEKYGISYMEWEPLLLRTFGLQDLELYNNNPTGTIIETFRTIDILVLERLSQRHITLTIANEYTKRLILEIYAQKVRYFLENRKIELMIFPETPHAYGDYVFLAAAIALNIPVYMIKPIGIVGKGISSIVNWKESQVVELSAYQNNKYFKSTETIQTEYIDGIKTALERNKDTNEKPYAGDAKLVFKRDLDSAKHEGRFYAKKGDSEGVEYITLLADTVRYLSEHEIDNKSTSKDTLPIAL